MSQKILKTPLLQYLAMFYGHLGVQLLALKDLRSVINFIFNIAVNILTAYGLSGLDILEFDSYQSKFQTLKPIYSTYLRICLEYILPFAFVITKIFYIIYGGQLMRLLDSSCFRLACSAKKTKIFFVVMFVVTHLYYFILNYHSFTQIFTYSQDKVKDLLSYLSQYVLGFTHYFPCILEHYFQYASHQCLCKIERMLQSKSPNIEFTVIKQVRHLAMVSEQVNRIMSFPVFIFVSMRVINGISVFCLVMMNVASNSFVYIVPSSLTWLYVVYLMYLNQLTIKAFTRICVQLRGRHRPSQTIKSIDSPTSIMSRRFNSNRFLSGEQTKQSFQIRFHEMELYRSHFEIRAFSMAQVDTSFLLGTTLFILNYVVFLYQTN